MIRVSNDLISRKALMEGRVENDPVRIAAMCADTAFNKERVIEELDKLTGEECTLHECGIRSERCKPCIAKKAIEIVEKGGVE